MLDIQFEFAQAWKRFRLLAECDTADEIALFLEEQGITGERAVTNTCPIANFVQNKSGIIVVVDAKITGLIHPDDYDFTRQFRNSTAMFDFIRDFDAGEFSFLQEPEWVGE